MKNKKRIIIFTALLTTTLISAWVLKIIFYKPIPTISVDYSQKIDKLTKPQNFDPNENAAPIIINALKSLKGYYVPSSTCYNMPIRIDNIHPKRLEHLNKWIESNETGLTLTGQATNKPYYWEKCPLGIDFMKEDHTWQQWLNVSDLVDLLIWRARFHEKDDPSKALEDLLLAYKVTDYITVIYTNSSCDAYPIGSYPARERISKNLNDVIQNNSIDSELLKQAQHYFENLKPKRLTNLIEISRMISLDGIQRSFTDDGNGNGKYISAKFSEFDSGLMGRTIHDYPAYFKYKRRIKRNIDNRKITTEKSTRHMILQKKYLT